MNGINTNYNSYRNQWENMLKDGTTDGKTEETEGTDGAGQVWNAVFTDKKDNGVSVDDFLNLMVVQLQNQDFMNPVDDTQYVTQLAQFATMQQMQEMATYMKTNYVMSLVGQEITAAKFTVSGELQKETGKVEKISLVNNEFKVYVNGKQFTLEQIMEVHGNKATDKSDPEQLNYLMSLVGKEITVRKRNEEGEATGKLTGVVEKISTEDGKYQVCIDGEWYPLEDVLEVSGSDSKADRDYLYGLIGYEVTVRERDEFGDPAGRITGVVERVSTEDGKFQVCIDGEWYPLDDVIDVGDYIGEGSQPPVVTPPVPPNNEAPGVPPADGTEPGDGSQVPPVDGTENGGNTEVPGETPDVENPGEVPGGNPDVENPGDNVEPNPPVDETEAPPADETAPQTNS